MSHAARFCFVIIISTATILLLSVLKFIMELITGQPYDPYLFSIAIFVFIGMVFLFDISAILRRIEQKLEEKTEK